jgi:RNA-directed DNA polymerase
VQTSIWSLFARYFVEPLKAEEQMTANADATVHKFTNWKSIPWIYLEKHVKRLQVRIAKAASEGKHGRVKALQWILTHSCYAKLLAVKRVTENKGKNTPGIDGVVWKTVSEKLNAVNRLDRRSYQS